MNFWTGPDDCAAAQESLYNENVTDGLPVIPPTRERVERMLAANAVDPDASIATMMPSCANATWRDIAINAVMAGAKPEYLPVIGAAIEAMCADEFNLLGIASTTGSACPIVLVNGPIVRKINMNAGGNALGPGNHANATIGRAVSLVLRNIGGAKPGEMDMATLGQPAKYTCVFAENEEASPWDPLHVERGFAKEASVVTVIGISGTIEIVDSSSNKPEDLAQTFAQSMLIAGIAGSGGFLGSGQPFIIMPPEIAQVFHQRGFSKRDVRQAILERAVMPVERLSNAVREHRVRLAESSGNRGTISELRIAEDEKDVLIAVVGGVGVKAAYLPTWSGGTRAVSREIDPHRT